MTPFRTVVTTRPDGIYELILYKEPGNTWRLAVYLTPIGTLARAERIENLNLAEHPELNALINWKQMKFIWDEVQLFVNAIREAAELVQLERAGR